MHIDPKSVKYPRLDYETACRRVDVWLEGVVVNLTERWSAI